MARYIGPVCKLCRRESVKLFLKGDRCSGKCPMDRDPAPPGQHAHARAAKPTEYGKRLRETQKFKRYYGLFDRQFRAYLLRAQRSKENTGLALLGLLERRLDNVVYKLGLAPSRKAARISIGHRHFLVNGVRVNKPGYLVKVGDVVTARERETTRKMVRAAVELDPNRSLQSWLKVDPAKLEGNVVALPTRDDVQIPVEEQLVVEFYSR